MKVYIDSWTSRWLASPVHEHHPSIHMESVLMRIWRRVQGGSHPRTSSEKEAVALEAMSATSAWPQK